VDDIYAGGQKLKKKGGPSLDSIAETMDMLTKGAELLGNFFPAEQQGDDDDEVAVEVEEDERPARKRKNAAGAGDPLQAILGQVLQNGQLQENLMQMVGGFLAQPGADKKGTCVCQ
jgi:hypothetical protein